MNQRQREIDFLRGIAIILVLFRHHTLFPFTIKMGWIGVDLFFVLSGFLISNMLFKELKKTGRINIGNFLIRRAFKIYPVFYAFIVLTICTQLIIGEKISLWKLTGELLFLQNYMGRIWDHTWSLAVEEHFYIVIILVFPFLAKHNFFNKTKAVIISFTISLIACFLLRVCTNIYQPDAINSFESHLRFDSLLAGVFVSYLFNFKNKELQLFVEKHKLKILLSIPVLISFTPFIEPLTSFFIKTMGFSFLYIAFSFLLIYFITTDNINKLLDKLFGSMFTNLISKIGIYSYSIYILHLYVLKLQKKYFFLPEKLNFIVYFILSIVLGTLLSKYFEIPILKIRDKFFPKKITTLKNNI